MLDGLIAMNAPPDVIDRAKARFTGQDSQDCEIWPENLQAYELFEMLATQWRITDAGFYIGIDYPSVQASMAMIGIKAKQRSTLFEDIRTMERAALQVLNRKKD